MADFWYKHWNNIDKSEDLQSQVERTDKKIPVQTDIWVKTLDFVQDNMELNEQSRLLELCCGNGMLSIPFAKKINSVVALDFSMPLLDELQRQANDASIKNISILCCSALDYPLPNYTTDDFSHILLYSALQYFSEYETIQLFEQTFQSLQQNGLFYIGDIPDREKLWDFANTIEYEKMYFDSVRNKTSVIGTWFMRNDLMKLARYAGFSSAEIIIQPDYQISSRYRFDMKLIK